MKVLLICKALHFTYKGGIQTHVWELSEELIRRGLDVHILAGARPSLRVQRKQIEGRTIIELPTLPGYRIRWFANTVDEISFNLQVVRWLNRHAGEYDIIHFHGRSGIAWPALYRNRLANCLMTIHGLTEEEWRHNRKTLDRWIHARISNWAERKAARKIPILVAVSLDQADRIYERFGRARISIRMIPNAIAEHPYIPFSNQGKIAFVGRMELIKGVDILPEVLVNLPEHIQLYMIGKGPEEANLRREFSRKGVADRVIWTGAIEPDEVIDTLGKCDLLVLPSRYEPQGRVVLEAMSIGRPFVASRVGGIQDMLRNGKEGILVDINDVREVTRQIRDLIEHPANAEAMGINGRRTVHHFYSWESIGEEIVEVYRELAPSTTKAHVIKES